MIKTSKLQFSYSSENSFSFPDISLPQGEHLLILGSSGVGKTTLLHLLAGLLPSSSGSITIGSTELQKLSRKKLDAFRGREMGIIFQNDYFINALSVSENLKLRLYFPDKKKDTTRVKELAERLGISNLLHKKVTALSEGQRQRLSIALALVNKPNIIFADEPTASLDDENCEKVVTLLKEEASNSNANLLIITHDQRVKTMFKNHLYL
ncbi:ABC transporter ATP-binding protein [Cellulophaga omnivescoria]|uniref:ABC transporter ATP-binding protein n=1 Tax=Cellulophaga omnivescoria TaxID=1888890 RepID=UPI001FE5399F|nr:ATP-binding cassette domain-containing protein [Cellulophaga omnivescoria]WBU90907.1 ATP-binding cassette domain-containing protein [Cellulophaga omnivescoria]WKB83043.1 ATP-binding cassette domain-containing protein [Cellulophaga lytica]